MTSEAVVLPVRASKPGGGRFAGLDLKTGDASGAAEWRLRKARGVIAKLASRRNEVVNAACPSGGPIKNWTVLPLRVFGLYAYWRAF